MRRNYKFHNPEGLSFVSFAVVEWAEVFLSDQYKDIIVDNLNYYVESKGMEIISWCIMPTHTHSILRTKDGIAPQNVPGDFKRFTSKAVDYAGGKGLVKHVVLAGVWCNWKLIGLHDAIARQRL